MSSSPAPGSGTQTTARLAIVGTTGIKQWQDWGTFREMKDDRVNFATQYAERRRFVYEYTMRAIAAGKFARPPTVGELMYDPEVRGQTAYEAIEIKAK